MGFQLKIAEGKDAGKEFEFDQDSVLIGRTPECDVVLYDAGVSRKHCRIFGEGGRFLIEDMGSSNGTKVNGASITKKQALAHGDQLTLGPVVFVFGALEEEEAPAEPNTDAAIPAPPPDGDANSTRIVSVDKVKPRAKNKGEALKPEGDEAQPENLANLQRSATRALPAMRPARSATGSSARTGSSAAIERASPSSPAPRRPSTASSGAVERAGARPGGLSAADRARIKRESPGAIAQIKLFWLQAGAGAKRAVIGGFVALALAAVGGAYWFVINSGNGTGPKLGNEPTALGPQPITDSFGLGQGVTWQHADSKTFTWEYAAATRAVVILHFQAQGISQGEVMVTVNGVDVNPVPPDTLASKDRSLDLMIPPNLLKKGETNRITFDNTKNPPNEDEWRIWNVWVEKALLPDLPPDQLEAEARRDYERGRINFERADVGARNRYEAWKSFREAWLLLEAHPEPKPDLYYEARDRVKDAQQELDKTCAKLLLETEGYYNQHNYAAAKHTLEYIREYFPEFDQPCAIVAENKRAEYGL